jgi:predicted ribosomally synthesized peptide with nif11-like leader
MIEKAKTAKSADELLKVAKENGINLTFDEANTYFAQLNSTSDELSDDELDNVSGGGCSDDPPLYRNYTMVHEFFCTNCLRVYPASRCKVMHFDNKDDVAYCPDCQGEVLPDEEFVHGKI